jgi:hypothetical protein
MEFTGVVDYCGGPATPRPADQISPAFVIGDRDVVSELDCSPLDGKQVRLTVAGIEAVGRLTAMTGSRGYSEWTPGENDTFDVGDVDLLVVALGLDGQQVTMTIEADLTEDEVARPGRGHTLTVPWGPGAFRL